MSPPTLIRREVCSWRPYRSASSTRAITAGGIDQVINNFPVDGKTDLKVSTISGTPVIAASRLQNISTRGSVEIGDNNVMIGGFIISGQPQQVLIRALGPTLTQFGVPNVLANPQLTLFNEANQPIASNDNWQATVVDGTIITSNQVSTIQSTGKAPPMPNESAILATLAPGRYTAIVSGVSNTTGAGLVELYALGSGTATSLSNISTRGLVQTGDNIMIGGFIISGQPQQVLIRALVRP